MSASHFRRLENMYRSAPVNVYYEPRITIGEGIAEISIPVKPSSFHAAGALHGAVYFKLLDDAAFFAANSLVKDTFVLTTSFTVYLTRPVTGGTLTSRGRVASATKSLIVAEAVVTNDDGKEVGRGSGTFMRSQVPLTPEIGYAD